MTIKLGVNIDHVATVRQARGGNEPDPIQAAILAERGGANFIVCHLREDRRHIQDEDVRLLKEVISTRLNLEMGLADDIIEVALEVKQHRVTLVPEKRQELTTEGGLNVIKEKRRIKDAIRRLKQKGIKVSLFIDPDIEQIDAAHFVRADIIELHTGRYANAKNVDEKYAELIKLQESAKICKKMHFYVAAGHGLNYKNTYAVAKIPNIVELNIGHSIISRAVFVGIERAVREMKDILTRARA